MLRVKVPRGRYRIDITGDADTIVLPNYLYLDCDEGVTFVWDYWGSPLFAAVNKSNVGIIGANFEWGGTFGTTSGTRDAFGYGAAIPAYEWCTHIAAPGTDNLLLEALSCAGATTANRQNSLALIKPKSDFTTPVRNTRIREVVANDVSQGLLAGGMKDFVIERLRSDRYANDSNGLYGPGHLIYFIENGVPSTFGRVENVRDYCTSQLSAYAPGGHAISAKNVQFTDFSDVFSARPEGLLNSWKTRHNTYEMDWVNTTDLTTDTSNGIIFFPGTGSNFNDDNHFDCDIQLADGRDTPLFNQRGVVFGSQIKRMTGEVRVRHSPTGAQTSQSAYLTCQNSKLHLELLSGATNVKKVDVEMFAESTVRGNDITVSVIGVDAVSSSPRVAFGAGSNYNRVTFRPGPYFDYDRQAGFADASGNSIVIADDATLVSSRTAAAGQNPTLTFALPKKGAYLIDLTLISSDENHALGGLYRVEWDGGNTNNFTSVQLLGATVSKGTQVTALTPSVDTAGNVSVATTTTVSGAFSLRVGYKRLFGL